MQKMLITAHLNTCHLSDGPQEIDYIQEGRNSDRFRRNFRDTPWVTSPPVYWALSSPRVLTLAYMPGAALATCNPDGRRLFCAALVTPLGD